MSVWASSSGTWSTTGRVRRGAGANGQDVGTVKGSNGNYYNPCQSQTDAPSCQTNAHQNATIAKVGYYVEKNWLNGGSVPVIFPHIAIPQLGLRYKPIKEIEARASLGFSLTGFWFGLSADYGLENVNHPEKPESAPRSPRRRRPDTSTSTRIRPTIHLGAPMPESLPRYGAALHRLGAGAGGEVWAVRDRALDRVVALKLLAAGAGEAEMTALVREAIALSGLEGLGVPRVLAFGALPGGQRFLVRELVEGSSLDEVLSRAGAPWLGAIASACDALTVVHRAGLLHGDIKPANIIVGATGSGTFVDLGLATSWREGGPAARGLTPRYAAPELLRGEAPGARCEVYSLGVTLAEALERRGSDLAAPARAALAAVASRAMDATAAARWPSVDEFAASAVRHAAGLPPGAGERGRGLAGPRPPDGDDASAPRPPAIAPPGGAIALEGPRRGGQVDPAQRRIADRFWRAEVRCGVALRRVRTGEPRGGDGDARGRRARARASHTAARIGWTGQRRARRRRTRRR